jgi:hypothetical protein
VTPDFETDLIMVEHALERLLSQDIPPHFADRLADDGARLTEAAKTLNERP